MKDFKGLFRDSTIQKNPVGTWQNAKNILYGKKFNSPLNENGTKYMHKARGFVRGIVETNKEIIYFSKINDTGANSLISVYDLTNHTMEERIKGNFNFTRPIEGVFKYDFKGDLIVAWCDGVFSDSNTMKIAKLTNIDYPLTNGILQEQYHDLIELFPNINKGNIEAKTAEGNIDGLYAFATFKYCYKDQETNFKNVNTYCMLQVGQNRAETLRSKGIKLELRNLDYIVYDSIKIGLYIVGEEENQSYISKEITIESSSKDIYITSLNNYTQISNEEILIPKDFFVKGETITSHKDSILIGKVHKNEEFKFQKYANLLRLQPVTSNEDDVVDIKFLNYNEVYAIYIQLELNNGDVTNWFHIPNNIYDASELEDADASTFSTYNLSQNRFTMAMGYKKFHFNNSGDDSTKFGLWANEETYPDDDEYNSTIDYDGNTLTGEDLRGTPIRHHRIKEESVSPFENNDDVIKYTPITGARITNFSSIPLAVRNQIRNVRLGFAKRELGNSLVVANGVMVNVTANDLAFGAGENNKVIDLESILSTPFSLDTADDFGMAFNRALFLSPEIEKFKPKLNFNVTLVKDIEFRDDEPPGGDYTSTFPLQNPSVLPYNKFYYGFYSYHYKLPNNAAQGSQFLDGGLFINYDGEHKNYIRNNDSFCPMIRELETINPATGNTDDTKVFRTTENKFLPFIHVALMNFQPNLYSINDNDIVASNNTLTVSEVLQTNTFNLGDCSFAEIKGSLKYRKRRDTFYTYTYKVYPLRELVVTPFTNSKLKVQTTETLYPDRELSESQVDELNSLLFGYDVVANEKWTTVNNQAQFEAFNIKNNYIEKFPYRIIRSDITPDEGLLFRALTTFYSTNYFEVQNNKGDIIALRSNDDLLFIQLRHSLMYSEVKDVITTDDVDAFLQPRDIFDRDPKSMTYDPKGFIGCEHKFACKMTKEGYITVDHRQGNIIIASPEVKIISAVGLRNWMLENLEFEEEYYELSNNINAPIDDPFNSIGFALGYDYEYNRLFLSKLYPEVNGEIEDINAYYQALLNEPAPSAEVQVKLKNPKSFTYSFSLDVDFWLCPHDFVVNKYIEVKKTLIGVVNTAYGSSGYGASHLLNRGNKGEYFGLKYPSYIDVIFNSRPDIPKLYKVVHLHTELDKQQNVLLSGDSNKTINAIVVFNEKQCSGEIPLDLNNPDIIRDVEGVWKVNNFRDLIINPDLPILDDDGDIILSNLNFGKEWFDKSYFISKFIVVRCIWNNDTNEDVYLNEIKMVSGISKR